MKMSDYVVRQNSYAVEFGSDIRTGRIEFASYGSDSIGYSPLVKEPLELKDGGLLDLIVLWCLGFQYGVRDCVNDFLDRVVPIVKNRFRQIRGWFSMDDVANMQTDIWMILSGNGQDRKNAAKTFDPLKGGLSTWIGYRVWSYVRACEQKRKLARKLLGLSAIVDDDTPLSSIGDKGLFGLTFESADDSDQKPSKGKWIKMSAKAGILEKVIKTENERAVESILDDLDPVDRDILNQRFLDGCSFRAIRDSLESRKIVRMTMNGVRVRCERVLNELRTTFGVKGRVIGMKGKRGRVLIAEDPEDL